MVTVINNKVFYYVIVGDVVPLNSIMSIYISCFHCKLTFFK